MSFKVGDSVRLIKDDSTYFDSFFNFFDKSNIKKGHVATVREVISCGLFSINKDVSNWRSQKDWELVPIKDKYELQLFVNGERINCYQVEDSSKSEGIKKLIACLEMLR